LTAELAGPFCAFMSSVTWAVGSANYSRLSGAYSAFAVNFARALIALPLFVLAAFVTAGGWGAGLEVYGGVRLDHLGWFGLSMIASYGLGDALFFWSTRVLGVPSALAIASCYPLWTALLDPSRIGGILVTVAGVVTVILTAPLAPAARAGGGSKRLGVLLALATSVLWAVNTYSVARGGSDLPAAVGNTLRMSLALAINLGFGAVMLGKRFALIPSPEIGRYLWLFAFEAFGGSYFFMYGLSNSALPVAATLSSLAPVLVVPIAWAMRLEKPTVFRTLGVALVVFGLWLLVR
jgi:drug/metabolite transporter (DMT)-like permease